MNLIVSTLIVSIHLCHFQLAFVPGTKARASPLSEPLSSDTTDQEDGSTMITTANASINESGTEDIRPRSTATTATVTVAASGSSYLINPLVVETTKQPQAQEYQTEGQGQEQACESCEGEQDTTLPTSTESSPISSGSVSTTTMTTLERELTQRSTSVSIDEKDKYIRFHHTSLFYLTILYTLFLTMLVHHILWVSSIPLAYPSNIPPSSPLS